MSACCSLSCTCLCSVRRTYMLSRARPPCDSSFLQPRRFLFFSFWGAVPLLANWVIVQKWRHYKCISVDDSHLSVKIPSNHPERISVVSRPWSLEVFRQSCGMNRQMASKGRGGPVEPATVAEVQGSGCFWHGASSHEIVAGPQPEPKPLSD